MKCRSCSTVEAADGCCCCCCCLNMSCDAGAIVDDSRGESSSSSVSSYKEWSSLSKRIVAKLD